VPIRDWVQWHEPYDDPDSWQSQRLQIVQGELAAAIDDADEGPIALLSLCAGDGRDVVGVLSRHRRQSDVDATLVEVDSTLAARARSSAVATGLRVNVLTGDAADVETYRASLPAHIVLSCGVFGNVVDDEIHSMIQDLGALVRPDGVVIWTRHRRKGDLTPTIRGWFREAGFDEVAWHAPANPQIGVGVHRYRGTRRPMTGRRLFTFR
jgi:hypothetical protein